MLHNISLHRVAIPVFTKTDGCSLGPSSNSASIHTSSYRRCENTAYLPKGGPEKQGQLSAGVWECMSSRPKVSTSCSNTQHLPGNCLWSEVGLIGSNLADTLVAVLDRRSYQGHYAFLWWSPNPTAIIRDWAFYFCGLCLNQDVKTAYLLPKFCHLVEGGGSEYSQGENKHLHKEAQLLPSDGFDVFMPHVQEAGNPFSMVAVSQGLAGVAAHHGRQNFSQVSGGTVISKQCPFPPELHTPHWL